MNIKLKNTEAVQKVFSGLSEPLQTKILKKALTILSKPILESAKSKIWSHQRKGRLYRSLGQKASKRNGNQLLIIGARKGGRFRGYHAHLLENDTQQRSYFTKKGVRHNTGKTRGIKFWSSSVEEGSNKAESEFTSYIIQSIEKEVNSLYRKANK